VSHRTIERLVEAGLLKREQVTARAPWRIRRTDLNDKPVRSVIERLLRTGKLVLQGGNSENQATIFIEKEGDDWFSLRWLDSSMIRENAASSIRDSHRTGENVAPSSLLGHSGQVGNCGGTKLGRMFEKLLSERLRNNRLRRKRRALLTG